MLITERRKKKYCLTEEEMSALKMTYNILNQIVENDEELSEAIRCESCSCCDVDDTREMIQTIINLNGTDIDF